MTGFKIDTFSGKAPKVFARLLPNDMAQVADNVRLDSGRLDPWKGNAATSISPVVRSVIESIPELTLKVSLPAFPVRVSLPPFPVILSLPGPPLSVSAPDPPLRE